MAKLAITLKGDESKFYFILLYGDTGMGKTPLAATAPGAYFVDSERGMKSAKGTPRIRIKSLKEAKKAVKQLEKESKCKTIIIDSLSHIAKLYLRKIKPNYTNKMQAYGDLFESIMDWVENLKGVQKNVIVICRLDFFDDNGKEKYRPMFPGNATTKEIAYEFESVFALRVIDDMGEDDEGGDKVLQTAPDEFYVAKDRNLDEKGSPKLDQYETTLDFKKLFKKMEA